MVEILLALAVFCFVLAAFFHWPTVYAGHPYGVGIGWLGLAFFAFAFLYPLLKANP